MTDFRHASRLSPIDITTSAFVRDPLPGYAELRAKCPVSWHPSWRCWAITRHADAAWLLRDASLNTLGILTLWTRLKQRHGMDFPAAVHIASHMPFNYEGKRHVVLRRAIARAIAPLADHNETFRAVIDKFLARASADGGFDLAQDFANRLLFEIICDLAKFPESDRAVLYPMSRASWALDSLLSISRRQALEKILSESYAVLLAETKRQVALQSDSLIGGIYRELPEEPEEERVASTAALLAVMLMMGNDATAGAIVGGVNALLNPLPRSDRLHVPQKQWSAVSDDALRYTATVDFVTRVATKDIAIDTVTICPGEVMIISPLSANHDKAEFGEDADMVRVRPNKDVGLTFGAGRHLCVGMRMARNVVHEAFAALSDLPSLRQTGPYEPTGGMVVRAPHRLPIVFD